ncbi:MAG: hypothetical protein KGZ89_08115 [Actinobacteria bacterium]|nr:hypothetical protein [Actinomycetota bacterium]
MSGAPDAEYIVARTVLLDALEALGPHREAAVLVGAQAVYIHTGDAGLAVAESTTDGDLALDPARVPETPEIAAAMRSKKFFRDEKASGPDIGIWSSLREIDGVPAIVKVDLLMPEAVGGGGRRAARVKGHEEGSVLKVRGLEGCLVDRTPHVIAALDEFDSRAFEIMVAGPAALLVSKLIKLKERTAEFEAGGRDRRKNKDALDVLRILRAADAKELATTLRALGAEDVSAEVTREAMEALGDLFGTADSSASQMAADAAFPEPREIIAASCAALVGDLVSALNTGESM